MRRRGRRRFGVRKAKSYETYRVGHPAAHPARSDRLPRQKSRRRQNPTRSQTSPQTPTRQPRHPPNVARRNRPKPATRARRLTRERPTGPPRASRRSGCWFRWSSPCLEPESVLVGRSLVKRCGLSAGSAVASPTQRPRHPPDHAADRWHGPEHLQTQQPPRRCRARDAPLGVCGGAALRCPPQRHEPGRYGCVWVLWMASRRASPSV